MAQAKTFKGNNANQKGKGGNKSWKNKSKGKTDNSKKELAASVKKATQLIEQGKLNAVEQVKKRKVNWPTWCRRERKSRALRSRCPTFNLSQCHLKLCLPLSRINWLCWKHQPQEQELGPCQDEC